MAGPGEGPGEAPEVFWRPGLALSKGLDDRPPPPSPQPQSQGLDPVLNQSTKQSINNQSFNQSNSQPNVPE